MIRAIKIGISIANDSRESRCESPVPLRRPPICTLSIELHKHLPHLKVSWTTPPPHKGGNLPKSRGHFGRWRSEGDAGKGTDKCHDKASLSRPLVLSLAPYLPSQFPFFSVLQRTFMGGAAAGLWQNGVGGEGDRLVMTFSDVFLPVPFLASPFDLHRFGFLQKKHLSIFGHHVMWCRPARKTRHRTYFRRTFEFWNPNHHYFSKKVSQYTSHLYCSTPPICIAMLLVPLGTKEREILSVLLPFVSQYAHLYCNTPPICIAVLLRKSWWLRSPGCSPLLRNQNEPFGTPFLTLKSRGLQKVVS